MWHQVVVPATTDLLLRFAGLYLVLPLFVHITEEKGERGEGREGAKEGRKEEHSNIKRSQKSIQLPTTTKATT